MQGSATPRGTRLILLCPKPQMPPQTPEGKGATAWHRPRETRQERDGARQIQDTCAQGFRTRPGGAAVRAQASCRAAALHGAEGALSPLGLAVTGVPAGGGAPTFWNSVLSWAALQKDLDTTNK